MSGLRVEMGETGDSPVERFIGWLGLGRSMGLELGQRRGRGRGLGW